ncbi:MAG: UDP-glucose pyrophosphorylase [Methanobacterium sp. Maddingley MBC34]|nr:MAG: UDP-glucose pyrophosphorylase [Methanobacterium sp. Maddingley MBC34]
MKAVILAAGLGNRFLPATKAQPKEMLPVYIIAIEMVPNDKIQKYCIIKGNEVSDTIYKIEDMIEKPKLDEAPSDLAITGRYLLTPEIFGYIEEILPGFGGEIQLTDALRLLDTIYGYVFEGKMYDIGNTVEWLKVPWKLH